MRVVEDLRVDEGGGGTGHQHACDRDGGTDAKFHVGHGTERAPQGRLVDVQETSKIVAVRVIVASWSCEHRHNGRVKILLVEDDLPIAVSLVDGLEAAGHDVVHVTTGRAGVDRLDATVELVLLDLGLPDIDGRDVCRSMRRTSDVPIIMLTARGDELDRVLGLELGADDYVTKPFSTRELIARIRAIARRAGASSPVATTASIGPLSVDTRTRRVHLDGAEIVLTAKEFGLLAYLASDPGAVRTRTDILEHVWDHNGFGPTKTVDAHVAAVRKKLGDARWIDAVRGVGFRLELPT